MSTREIREALTTPPDVELLEAAMREVDAIERALVVGHRILSGDLHVVSQAALNAASRIMREAHEMHLRAEGSKETDG